MDTTYSMLITSSVGCAMIVYMLSRLLGYLWILFRCYFLTSLGFVADIKKYGEWVVVTGATDGIGKEYARQLAKRGFNIVLISRGREKLERVAVEISKEFGVETKSVCFDFTQTNGYDAIEDAISGLDVGILVNNVGMTYGGGLEPFTSYDIHRVHDVIHCNVFSDVHLTHMLCKSMETKKRGLIIHISSLVVYLEAPFMSPYSPTKQFMKKFVTSLQLEHCNVIHHQLVTPGYVATNMTNKKPGFMAPSAEDYVRSAIRTIGICNVTCGYFMHELLAFMLGVVPQFILSAIMRGRMMKSNKKE